MELRNLLLAALPALLALQFASCSDPPQPVDTPKAAPAAGQVPPGHPPMEPGVRDDAPETKLAGSIALEGEKFDAPGATIFVSVRPKGQKGPWLSRKYPMQSPAITNTDGNRTLAFELRSADPTGETFSSNRQNAVPAGIEVELCVQLKATGFVDSATMGEVVAAFESGKSDYALTLRAP